MASTGGTGTCGKGTAAREPAIDKEEEDTDSDTDTDTETDKGTRADGAKALNDECSQATRLM
jgi:hypothetical protein